MYCIYAYRVSSNTYLYTYIDDERTTSFYIIAHNNTQQHQHQHQQRNKQQANEKRKRQRERTCFQMCFSCFLWYFVQKFCSICSREKKESHIFFFSVGFWFFFFLSFIRRQQSVASRVLFDFLSYKFNFESNPECLSLVFWFVYVMCTICNP